MLQLAPIAPPFDAGLVWLAGAGPRDPWLLPSHAARALTHADTVPHNALVSEEIVSLARKACLERMGGKRTPRLPNDRRLLFGAEKRKKSLGCRVRRG
jgi:uroporphyrin-III C-methyltransferase